MGSAFGLIVSGLLVAVALAESYAFASRFIAAPWLSAFLVNGFLAALVLLFYYRRSWDISLPSSGPPALLAVSHSLHRRPLLSYVPALIIILGAVALAAFSALFSGARSSAVPTSQWAFVLLVPVVEELVFRAGFGGFFRRRGGLLLGGYLSALVFAFVHSLPTASRLMAGEVGLPLGPFLLGLACEAIFILSGRLGPAVALHMACNGTVIVFAALDSRWLSWLDALYLG